MLMNGDFDEKNYVFHSKMESSSQQVNICTERKHELAWKSYIIMLLPATLNLR